MDSPKNNKHIFEEITNMIDNGASDEQIKEIFEKIKSEDFYLTNPIVYDLISNKRINILDYLYEKKIPLSYVDNTGATPLHVACAINGSLEAVRFLFEHHIATDINAKTDEGETPFLLAVMYEHEDILKYFLKHAKPNLQVTNSSGDTAFSLAENIGNPEILLLLQKFKSEDKLKSR
ncbi:MAG TPA: ankyrin repeat domain-containing protein [Candidatus Babeliales bacterium]|nr:ankyrin repeat domain-containing protein [Candidatus Babeliales bacterium]